MSFFTGIMSRDLKQLVHDFTKHFIYSIVLISCTSLLTFLLVSQAVQTQVSQTVQNTIRSIISPSMSPPVTMLSAPIRDETALYVERGSPYDNRTVEGASGSASVIFHGPRNSNKIALTFDAEMTEGMKADVLAGNTASSYDPRIVKILDSTDTPATIFLTGMWIELYPDITRQLAKDPLLEFGSHSYSDTSYNGFCYGLRQIPQTLRIEEIGATEKLLRENVGIDNIFFRFPGGCYTPDDVKMVNEANDMVVHWDVSGNDGFNQNTQQITNNVVDNVKNGSIIILHLNGAPNAPKTADALPRIISLLKSRGFKFVKVSELLGVTPPKKSENF